eukprot:6737589-Pyramimonas_sp.AAC.1
MRIPVKSCVVMYDGAVVHKYAAASLSLVYTSIVVHARYVARVCATPATRCYCQQLPTLHPLIPSGLLPTIM